MESELPKYPRILAIAPSTWGFGYALIEGQMALVDWGIKQVRGNKNKGSIMRIEAMVMDSKPQIIVLEDVWAKGSKRHARIRRLVKMIQALAKKRKVKAALFSRKRLMETFLADENGTKQQLAEAIVQKYEDKLAAVLPPKRKFYNPEDYRIDIFIAVALAIMLRWKK